MPNRIPGTFFENGEKRPKLWSNEFWNLMKKHNPNIKDEDCYTIDKMTPEVLRSIACCYFQDAENDMLIKKDYIRSGENAGKIIEIPIRRPYSITGLTLYVNAYGFRSSLQALLEPNGKNFRPEYLEVANWIHSVIAQDKFDGAAVGNFNPMLIVRDLGIAENVKANVTAEQPLFSDVPEAPRATSERMSQIQEEVDDLLQ